jgi:hypothetical protein
MEKIKDNNTYILEAKSDPSDRIVCEVGDSKQVDFYPQLKLMRWDNEINCSIRLKDFDNYILSVEGEKIKLKTPQKELHFYELPIDEKHSEWTFEFEVILNNDPRPDKKGDYVVKMSFDSKGLGIFYQPPLTEIYHNGYSKEFQKEIIVTETEVKDLDGNLLVVKTSEKGVGCYVLAHSSMRGNLSQLGGKNYKAGSAFLIERPRIIDATGNWIWGEYNKDLRDTKELKILIPQDFLNKAVYPIVVDPTFGDTTTNGTSASSLSANRMRGGIYTSPAGATGASIDSIVVDIALNGASANMKGVIVLTSTKAILTNGVGGAVALGARAQYTSSYSSKPTILASTSYALICICSGTALGPYNYYADVGSSIDDTSNNYDTPTDPTDWSTSSKQYQMYANYTLAAGGPANLKSRSGNLKANIKSMSGNLIANIKSLSGNS